MTAAAPDKKYPATLAEALAVFQASPPKIGKGNTAEVKNDQGKKLYEYSYADLADVNEEVLPRLGAVGLAFTARPTMQDGQFVLAYSLIHVSGEREDGVYPLQANLAPQKVGGLITYARRYCLCAVTGIAAAGDDDDASAAQDSHRQSAGDVFEQAAPARPQRNDRPQGQPARPAAVQAAPDPEAEIDPDAQALADEAHGCLSVTELRKVHARSANDQKLRACIADPATGTKGQLGSYLNHRKKALEDTDTAWTELYKVAEAHRMDIPAVEDHVRKVSGKTVEGATAADVRKAIEALKAKAA